MVIHNHNERLEIFCDGVFAIVLTILVLEIKVPQMDTVRDKGVVQALLDQWPSYLAFTFGFVAVFVQWVNHKAFFKVIDRTSPAFMYGNGFFLFTICLVPFFTAVLSNYMGTVYSRRVMTVYCFSCILNNIGWNVLYESAIRPINILALKTQKKEIIKIRNNIRVGLPLYTVIAVISIWLPLPAFIFNLLLWLLWIRLGMFQKVE